MTDNQKRKDNIPAALQAQINDLQDKAEDPKYSAGTRESFKTAAQNLTALLSPAEFPKEGPFKFINDLFQIFQKDPRVGLLLKSLNKAIGEDEPEITLGFIISLDAILAKVIKEFPKDKDNTTTRSILVRSKKQTEHLINNPSSLIKKQQNAQETKLDILETRDTNFNTLKIPPSLINPEIIEDLENIKKQTEAIIANPQNPGNYYARGLSYKNIGEYWHKQGLKNFAQIFFDLAKEDWQKALQLNNNTEKNLSDKKIEKINNFLKNFPTAASPKTTTLTPTAEKWIRCGEVYFRNNMLNLCIQAFNHSYKLAPHAPEIYENFGNILIVKNRKASRLSIDGYEFHAMASICAPQKAKLYFLQGMFFDELSRQFKAKNLSHLEMHVISLAKACFNKALLLNGPSGTQLTSADKTIISILEKSYTDRKTSQAVAVSKVFFPSAAEQLRIAIEKGNTAEVMRICESKTVDIHSVRYSNGNTPLHKAASFGQLKIAKYLVETCKTDPNVRNVVDFTPLDMAEMWENEIEIIEYLKGALAAQNGAPKAESGVAEEKSLPALKA